MAIRVLIVDDHPPFRAAARELLGLGSVFEVVDDVGTAGEVLEAVSRCRPDLVLLDIGLPDGDGFEVAALLAERVDAPPVVLISSRDRADYHRRLRHSRVRGFLTKDDLSVPALAALME